MKEIFAGEAGIGKSGSLAKLALDWAEGRQLQQFDFVFLVELRHVNKDVTLAQLIREQHKQLSVMNVSNDNITIAVNGSAGHVTLLLFDGYDEYNRGTNMDVESVMMNTTSNCSVVLTSRHLKVTGPEMLTKYWDAEMEILGFNDVTILDAATKFIDNTKKSQALIAKAKEVGVYEMLKSPVMLFLTCALSPKDLEKNMTHGPTRYFTALFEKIIINFMDKATVKHFKIKANLVKKLNNLLLPLGEMAWEALERDRKQLLINKVRANG